LPFCTPKVCHYYNIFLLKNQFFLHEKLNKKPFKIRFNLLILLYFLLFLYYTNIVQIGEFMHIDTTNPITITLDDFSVNHQTADIEIFDYIERQVNEIRSSLQDYFIKERNEALHEKNKNRRRFSSFSLIDTKPTSPIDDGCDPFASIAEVDDPLDSSDVSISSVKRFSSFTKPILTIEQKIQAVNSFSYQKIYKFLKDKNLLVVTFSPEFIRIKNHSATWCYDESSKSYTGPSNEVFSSHIEFLNKVESLIGVSKNSLVEELHH
jgi:hypothetical protein